LSGGVTLELLREVFGLHFLLDGRRPKRLTVVRVTADPNVTRPVVLAPDSNL
jgi:hypothetical protein